MLDIHQLKAENELCADYMKPKTTFWNSLSASQLSYSHKINAGYCTSPNFPIIFAAQNKNKSIILIITI